jgi:hypothetical protein
MVSPHVARCGGPFWRSERAVPPRGARWAGSRRATGPTRPRRLSALLVGDEANGVPDRADALGLLVADLDAELVLEAHDQLDDVERVRAQVVHERRAVDHVGGVGVELVGDDVLDLVQDGGFVHGILLRAGWSVLLGSRAL